MAVLPDGLATCLSRRLRLRAAFLSPEFCSLYCTPLFLPHYLSFLQHAPLAETCACCSCSTHGWRSSHTVCHALPSTCMHACLAFRLPTQWFVYMLIFSRLNDIRFVFPPGALNRTFLPAYLQTEACHLHLQCVAALGTCIYLFALQDGRTVGRSFRARSCKQQAFACGTLGLGPRSPLRHFRGTFGAFGRCRADVLPDIWRRAALHAFTSSLRVLCGRCLWFLPVGLAFVLRRTCAPHRCVVRFTRRHCHGRVLCCPLLTGLVITPSLFCEQTFIPLYTAMRYHHALLHSAACSAGTLRVGLCGPLAGLHYSRHDRVAGYARFIVPGRRTNRLADVDDGLRAWTTLLFVTNSCIRFAVASGRTPSGLLYSAGLGCWRAWTRYQLCAAAAGRRVGDA